MTAAHSRRSAASEAASAPVVVAAVVADLGRDRRHPLLGVVVAVGRQRPAEAGRGRGPQGVPYASSYDDPAPRPAGRREDTGRVR